MHTRLHTVALAAVASLACVAGASAQAPAAAKADDKAAQTQPAAPADTRPATTTAFGDTGLWYVPTAEVLANGQFSASGYRSTMNFVQGLTNVADFVGTAAVGVGNRVELFGGIVADRRIDRDIRPIFTANAGAGGAIYQYPFLATGWTGDNVGDLYIGGKFNLASEFNRAPAAFALRAMVKAPTGSADKGVGTGKPDVIFDAIVSKDLNKAEVSGYAGFIARAQPSGATIPNGVRWGAGLALMPHQPLHITAELHGETPTSSTMTLGSVLTGSDNSRSALTYDAVALTTATVGATWQARNGFFVGAGLNLNFPTKDRASVSITDTDVIGDYVDYQFRIGFHPGTRRYVARVPRPPPAPPTPPPAPVNHPPTVKAQCDPCTIEVGKTSKVTGDGRDPDGDTLVYKWSAPNGSFASTGDKSTTWTATNQVGAVPVTVTVDDGKGGTASDSVTINVIKPPKKEYTFEDVHFDFDRYSLRPDALRVLDEAVKALQENAGMNIEIEGHTCSIGTAEYNLALGDRRATAVREYLASRGVTASRLKTISYGEERPKFDNAREETRRLNRRAALVVRVQ